MFETPKLGYLRAGCSFYCSPASFPNTHLFPSITSCSYSHCFWGEDRPCPHEAGITVPPVLSPLWPLPPRPISEPQVATLEKRELWEKFCSVGTEMIVTKNGRRMFPEFCVSLSGLDPLALYVLTVEALPADSNRYKWRGGAEGWQQNGKAEAQLPARLYLHPESPAPGVHWMCRPVSFSKLKVTNNMLDQNGHLILCSMHKYHLRLCIVLASKPGSCTTSTAFSASVFPETSFIAVTSYQNEKLSQLKIEENPFAKGIKDFRKQKRREKMQTNGLERSELEDKEEERPPEYKKMKYSLENPGAGKEMLRDTKTPDTGREETLRETKMAEPVGRGSEGNCLGAPMTHSPPWTPPQGFSSHDAPSSDTPSPSLLYPLVDYSHAYPAAVLSPGGIPNSLPPPSQQERFSPVCGAVSLDSVFAPFSTFEAQWNLPCSPWAPFLGPHAYDSHPRANCDVTCQPGAVS
ncbi:T-box transcription factor TBX6 [Microcaecilia unicolor]|uniref:T-box transcription factor TBX6-like n=1 Tax=Microcaecilia unicolor TaxID=1415580 RepID=A0A6P7YGU2_9AMPH|nr:T-box transcription factor TBX6-like [Microcaecilia unicolor]